jgi:hypothetical protein
MTPQTLNSQLNSTLQGYLNGTGNLGGIAVNAATKTLYFTLYDNLDSASASDNVIESVTYTVSNTGVVTLGTQTTLYSGSGADLPVSLAIDPETGTLYTQQATTQAVEAGSLTGSSSVVSLYSGSLTTGDSSNGFGLTSDLVVLTSPIIASGATSAVTLNHTANVIADPTATVTNPDGQGLASATIVISGNDQTGDQLTASTSGGFTTSFSNGTLQITNPAGSLAAWQTELEGVAFQSTGAIQSVRTLTWSVSDGINTSNTYNTTVDVICFCVGTLIGTPAGEIPVEKLKLGDMVLTAHNGSRRVRWIGKGKVLATAGARSVATPVIVRKGALADNVPNQDLHVTKAHSLYIDGVLIPVEFLVNHKTIVWDDRGQEVEIYHVELESHDVLIANGAPAERFRDDGNRWLFQNAQTGAGLPPQEPYAPVLTGGPVVDEIWARLLHRAGPPDLLSLIDDPDLHLIIDGARVDAQERQGYVYVFHLPSRPGSVIVASRVSVPSELGTVRDPRALGVALRRVAIRQGGKFMLFEANDERLTAGFHDYEPSDNLRWTDGYAELPVEAFARFDKGAEVMLHLRGTTRYRYDRDHADQVAA